MLQTHMILVTGGAGFIGTYTVNELVRRGYRVHVLDSFEIEAHPNRRFRPPVGVTVTRGSVANSKLVKRLIQKADGIIHLASLVGVGQSMYDISRYVYANTFGTGLLLDSLFNTKNSVKKLVVASSASVYGEGRYRCETCGNLASPQERTVDALRTAKWEHFCEQCGGAMVPVATDEEAPTKPLSIYGLTKKTQEDMALILGKTYGLPTLALRYFNAYGPGQSLSNPYTGVCSIFASQILSGMKPFIFEDGKQLRSFIHVKDIAIANVEALETKADLQTAVNIGNPKPASINEIARLLLEAYGSAMEPFISNAYRPGDIRHYFPEMSRAKRIMHFEPSTDLETGVHELADWMRDQPATMVGKFKKALHDLERRGLVPAKVVEDYFGTNNH